MLTLALPTGRLGQKAINILNASLEDPLESLSPSRKLIYYSPDLKFRFIMVKPKDVPTYVEHGVADLGIVGKDVLLEENKELYEILDLNFGNCVMAVAGLPNKKDHWQQASSLRVATEYPNITRKYFNSLGLAVELVKLNGSVELGPLVGLADLIVDIVESGRTLKDNGLIVFAEILEISAKLVVNRVGFKTKNKAVMTLIEALEKTLEGALI